MHHNLKQGEHLVKKADSYSAGQLDGKVGWSTSFRQHVCLAVRFSPDFGVNSPLFPETSGSQKMEVTQMEKEANADIQSEFPSAVLLCYYCPHLDSTAK